MDLDCWSQQSDASSPMGGLIARIVGIGGSAINPSNEERCDCWSIIGLGNHLRIKLAHQRELRSLPKVSCAAQKLANRPFSFKARPRTKSAATAVIDHHELRQPLTAPLERPNQWQIGS